MKRCLLVTDQYLVWLFQCKRLRSDNNSNNKLKEYIYEYSEVFDMRKLVRISSPVELPQDICLNLRVHLKTASQLNNNSNSEDRNEEFEKLFFYFSDAVPFVKVVSSKMSLFARIKGTLVK